MIEIPTIEKNYDGRSKCRHTGRICQILFMRNCHSERIFLIEGSFRMTSGLCFWLSAFQRSGMGTLGVPRGAAAVITLGNRSQ